MLFKENNMATRKRSILRTLFAFKNKIRNFNLETHVGDDNCKDCRLCMGWSEQFSGIFFLFHVLILVLELVQCSFVFLVF